jgi:hypothetical protein
MTPTSKSLHHSKCKSTSIAFSGSGKSDAGDEKSFSTQSSSTTLNEDCGRNDLIDASSPMDTEMKSYKMVRTFPKLMVANLLTIITGSN